MHHLKHRSENGPTTIENGANVAEVAHQYLHSLPREQEEIINDMLRQWKRDFRIGAIEITTQGIQQAEVFEFEEPENDYFPYYRHFYVDDDDVEEPEEVIVIPAYDFTEEEYQKHLQERRKRELEKPKWERER